MTGAGAGATVVTDGGVLVRTWVTGPGFTEIAAVVDGHPAAVVHPAPVHVAVLVMVVPAATMASTPTRNDRSTVAPAARPAPMVQVSELPDTTTEQLGVEVDDSEPQLAEPAR